MSITGLSGVFGLHRQIGRDLPARGPYNAGVDAVAAEDTVQTLTITGAPASGSYRLSVRGQITAALAHDADNADIEGALEALSTVEPTDVSVTGLTTPFTLTWAGQYVGQAVGAEVYDSSLPAGSTIAMSSTGGSDVTGGAWAWLPATTVNFQPNQIVQAIPPEVGGTLFSRGSYKGGISGQGQVMLIPRGGLGLAELLLGFTGRQLTETLVAATYNAGTANKLVGDGTNGIPAGIFKYRFQPGAGSQTQLPWYTLVRNVGGVYVEEFSDARIGNFAFDMAASNILSIDAGFVSRKVGFIAKGAGAAAVSSQVAGNGRPFQSVDALIKLDTNVGGEPGGVQENDLLKPTRLNIAFANQLSQNEFVVGDHFLQDVTNLARTANVTLSCFLTNPELYARTYAHGADITGNAAWSSEIWKGALEVTLTGGLVDGESQGGQRYTIVISMPEMDYMAAPIQLAGNNLVEYQLTTNVVLPEDAAVFPFTIEYITDEDIL